MLPVAALGVGRTEPERVRRLVGSTPVRPAGSLSPGPVAVEGRVRKHRESVADPLDDGECVFARYERIRRTADGPGERAERTAETVPFVVADDTGRVLVDLREAVDADGDPVVVSAGNTDRFLGDAEGDRVVAVDAADGGGIEGVAEARATLGESPEWIHVRSTIRPGDRVYVLGEAAETPGGSPPHVVAPDADDTVVCSDLSQSALLEQLERAGGGLDRRFWAFAALGLIALVIAVVAIGVFVDSFVL